MSTPVPHHKPTATPAGQREAKAAAQAFLADIDSIMATRPMATAVRIDDPDIPSWQDGPRIGTTPAITNQPGSRRPAMSQRAVDLNATILSTSVVIASLGGAGTGILWASHYANPTVIQWICGCAVAVPAACALAALAFKSFMKSTKEVVQAAPPEIHNHYSGAVQVYEDRRTVNTRTNGLIASTRNELPPAR